MKLALTKCYALYSTRLTATHESQCTDFETILSLNPSLQNVANLNAFEKLVPCPGLTYNTIHSLCGQSAKARDCVTKCDIP